MEIRILGPGCINCQRLEQNVFNAAAELDLAADIQKVEDYAGIMAFGVMSTPALVINGKVVVSGRVPSSDEVKKLLNQYQG